MAERILIIDDDNDTAQGLRRLLARHGYEVKVETDSTKALESARSFLPSSVILDYLMPRAHGGDVAWQLASDPILRSTKIIMCSGVSPAELLSKLPPERIPILEKPIDSEALLQLLR